eukprot:g13255.t1
MTTTTIRAFLFFGVLLQLLYPTQGAGESSKGYDADLTLFSPEGRLYQVEYVMRAVGHYGCPAVGVHGEGCCVVACKRDVPDELVYPGSVSNIFRITDDIYSVATGLSGDVRYQVKRARLQALEYKRQYGSPMPSRLLTLAMADAAQVNTQHAALRPMACVSFVISVDDPSGPALFRVEPSGQVFQAWGTAAGRGSAASLEHLEEAYKAANAVAPAGEQGRGGSEGGFGAPAKGNASNSNSIKETEDDGERETEASADEDEEVKKNETDRRGNETAKHASDDHADDTGHSAGAKGRGARGRQDSGSRSGGDAVNVAEPPGGSSSRSSNSGNGRFVGFGVVGEGETVELALQALAKASSGKDAPPLTDKNVEIAIASRDTGVRVCSRKEVKGFLGKISISAECAPTKKSGR